MALSVRVEAFLKRLAAKGDVYATGILEAIKGEKSTNVSATFTKVLKNPAAAGTTNCVAASPGNAASMALTLAGQPDVARNVLATFQALYDGGDIVIVGIDHTGAQVTETLLANAGGTRAGTYAYSKIISATRTAVGATANTVSLGYGVKIGIGLKGVLEGSVIPFIGTAGAETGVTTLSAIDLTNGTVTFTTAPDGANDYVVMSAKA